MKESVLSVLVYLFRNYFLGEPDTVPARDSLHQEIALASRFHDEQELQRHSSNSTGETTDA